MLKNRYIDFICIAFALIALGASAVMFFGRELGISAAHTQPLYAAKLFDSTRVHTIDIVIDDWDLFLQNAPREQYSRCTVIIDGEAFANVGIRAKGNNSKRLVEKYSLSRYSLKLEMDHYTRQSYYGLDKFSLDSSFQDNSYMKTRIAYDMMSYMGVKTPLYSYVYVRVNGEDWGLFVALEEPEEAFAKRNYGANYGQLYKPDYKSLNDENNDVALKYTDDNFDS